MRLAPALSVLLLCLVLLAHPSSSYTRVTHLSRKSLRRYTGSESRTQAIDVSTDDTSNCRDAADCDCDCGWVEELEYDDDVDDCTSTTQIPSSAQSTPVASYPSTWLDSSSQPALVPICVPEHYVFTFVSIGYYSKNLVSSSCAWTSPIEGMRRITHIDARTGGPPNYNDPLTGPPWYFTPDSVYPVNATFTLHSNNGGMSFTVNND